MAYTPEEVEWMRKAMGITDEPEPIKPIVNPAVPAVSDAGEYLLLENIACRDAEGNEFERHGKIYVPKNIEKNADGSQISKTPYGWIAYFEQKGISLPSFALSCNILDALWQNRGNPEYMQVLMQYKDKGNGYGWHAQNTLVNWGSGQVIHYPSDADFTSNGGNSNVNNGRRKPLQFDKAGFNDLSLEDALKNANMAKFVRQLTGLRNPEVLVEIGSYFQKPAKVWVSASNEVRAAWLGCGDSCFDLDANNNLYDSNAARGVRASP